MSNVAARSHLPAFDAADVTPEQFCEAMQTHSVVHLKNAVPSDWVTILRQTVIDTYSEFHDYLDKAARNEPLPTTGFTIPAAYVERRENLEFFRSYASIVLDGAPMGAEMICRAIGENPVMDLLTAWFHARPMLALNASSLRKQELNPQTRCLWHQDGVFLGGVNAETINTWIALDDCGVDAPGVEVVSERLTELMSSGKVGAELPWEIFDADVDARFGQDIHRPVFKAGDILAFDAANLHRTYLTPGMTRERHACECWWYAPKLKYDHLLLAYA